MLAKRTHKYAILLVLFLAFLVNPCHPWLGGLCRKFESGKDKGNYGRKLNSLERRAAQVLDKRWKLILCVSGENRSPLMEVPDTN